jgi:hypothetical protein
MTMSHQIAAHGQTDETEIAQRHVLQAAAAQYFNKFIITLWLCIKHSIHMFKVIHFHELKTEHHGKNTQI